MTNREKETASQDERDLNLGSEGQMQKIAKECNVAIAIINHPFLMVHVCLLFIHTIQKNGD